MDDAGSGSPSPATQRLPEEEPGLVAIDTRPAVAIGQRALLVRTPAGNVMWDCITLLDEASVARVRELGGLAAIAISHPHFYATRRLERGLRRLPGLHPRGRREWVQYPGPGLRLWEGEAVEVLPGADADQHRRPLRGVDVLHWAAGATAAARC